MTHLAPGLIDIHHGGPPSVPLLRNALRGVDAIWSSVLCCLCVLPGAALSNFLPGPLSVDGCKETRATFCGRPFCAAGYKGAAIINFLADSLPAVRAELSAIFWQALCLWMAVTTQPQFLERWFETLRRPFWHHLGIILAPVLANVGFGDHLGVILVCGRPPSKEVPKQPRCLQSAYTTKPSGFL